MKREQIMEKVLEWQKKIEGLYNERMEKLVELQNIDRQLEFAKTEYNKLLDFMPK